MLRYTYSLAGWKQARTNDAAAIQCCFAPPPTAATPLTAAISTHPPVGNDFVGVHVALGAAACLPDDQGEVVRELPLRHLSGSSDDGAPNLVV